MNASVKITKLRDQVSNFHIELRSPKAELALRTERSKDLHDEFQFN